MTIVSTARHYLLIAITHRTGRARIIRCRAPAPSALLLQPCFALRALCSPVPMDVPTASRSLAEANVPRVRRQRAYGGLHAAISPAASFRWSAIGVGGGGRLATGYGRHDRRHHHRATETLRSEMPTQRLAYWPPLCLCVSVSLW